MMESLGMYHLKQKIDGLHPSIDVFDGNKPIRLLSFLAILRDTFGTLGTSEAAAVRLLAYFLEGEAKDVHAEQFYLVELDYDGDSPVESEQASWPHDINALLRRFLSDDILRKAYDGVTRSVQKDGEEESHFAERISKAARLCRSVFRNDELVNYYVQGLGTAVREIVAQQVRQMSTEDRESLSVVTQAAAAVGRTKRALMGQGPEEDPKKPSAGVKEKDTRTLGKTVLLTPPALCFDQGAPFEIVDQAREPEDSSIIDVAMGLGAILFAGVAE